MNNTKSGTDETEAQNLVLLLQKCREVSSCTYVVFFDV